MPGNSQHFRNLRFPIQAFKPLEVDERTRRTPDYAKYGEVFRLGEIASDNVFLADKWGF